MSKHFELSEGALANTVVRQLRKEDLQPEDCEYELSAIGPIFTEQTTTQEHRRLRDIVARLEAELSVLFAESGYKVIGAHPRRGAYDTELLSNVVALLQERYPRLGMPIAAGA